LHLSPPGARAAANPRPLAHPAPGLIPRDGGIDTRPGAPRAECYARGMKFFVKAVVTGFGLSLGSALFKKLQQKLGFEDEAKPAAAPDPVIKQDGATDPGLTAQPS